MTMDLFLDLPQQRTHLVDWGGPPQGSDVLLMHGLASNAKMWTRVAPKLAQHFRVVALDQRSHGLSSTPNDQDFSFAAHCDDIRAICDHLDWKRPLLVGHSWGANVAIEFAARCADRVSGIVLIEGGFIGLNKIMTWPQAEKAMAPKRWQGTPLHELQNWVKGLWGDLYGPEVADMIMSDFEVRADQTIAPRLSFDNHVKIQHAVWEQDNSLYAQVKCPVLFLPCHAPEPLDPIGQQFLALKRRMLTQAQTLMPDSQVSWLQDSIHDVPMQRPDLLAETIRAFAQPTLSLRQ